MVAIKLAAFSLLLVAVSALPAEFQNRAAHGGDWVCYNKQFKNGLTYISNQITDTLKKAPTTVSTTTYPRKFNNGYDEKTHNKTDGSKTIKFNSAPCDRAPTDTTYLVEFPILSTGKFYDVNKKPAADPGPASVVYYYPGKILCGVVAREDGNKGDMKLCTKER